MYHLKEPFRLFFPLAIAYLIAGVSLWLPIPFLPEIYPVQWHRAFVINGYLTCMIFGFLMTALPQFSGSPQTNRYEYFLALLLCLLPMLAGGLESYWPLSLTSILQALFLLFFIFIRFPKIQSTPPYSFIFLPIGAFIWPYAEIRFLFLNEPEVLFHYYEAATLAFIIGIGTRLIPGLLGHEQIVSYQRKIYENAPHYLKMIPKGFLLMAIVYLLSIFPWQRDLSFVRTAVLTAISLSYWRIFTLPTSKTYFSWSVWCCCWGIILAQYLKLFFPEYGIHLLHAHFVIGLVLLSLLVSFRVIRAHVLKDSKRDERKALLAITFFLLLSAATRVSAPFIAKGFENHLAYSSLMLLFGIIFWLSSLRKTKTAPLTWG